MTVMLKAPEGGPEGSPEGSPEVSGKPPARAEPRRPAPPRGCHTASAWRESHGLSALTWTWALYLPWMLCCCWGLVACVTRVGTS